jgi:hypothetical protein
MYSIHRTTIVGLVSAEVLMPLIRKHVGHTTGNTIEKHYLRHHSVIDVASALASSTNRRHKEMQASADTLSKRVLS